MTDNGARALATWTCEIGPADRQALPDGADQPMRRAVRQAFFELTGADPARLSSGWGRLPDAAELERLRAALERIAENSEDRWAKQQARTALEPEGSAPQTGNLDAVERWMKSPWEPEGSAQG